MHRQAHEIVARCACATTEEQARIEIPTEKIVARIMEPDRENDARIPHRAEGQGLYQFRRVARQARRRLHSPEFQDVARPLAEAIHLASDFCTMPHAPRIQKESVGESSYEREIEKMAQHRRIEPSPRAMKWYVTQEGKIQLDDFITEAHREHWTLTASAVTSTPSGDLEQAIYVASAVMLAICGPKPLHWEDTRTTGEKWAERTVMGGLCLIPVIGPALVASYYLTPPEERD